MTATPRQKLWLARRIVVKVGSHTVARAATSARGPGLDTRACRRIAKQIAELHGGNREVILVSSGAVAAGALAQGLTTIPHDIPTKQALAALGQGPLMHAWAKAFAPSKIPVAQVLLTRDDLAHRNRYLNSRETLRTLLKYRAVPVINENDTVAVHEIKVGDNDTLAAQVAALVEAHLLILLTTTDGLYTGDPHVDPDAEHIPEISPTDPQFDKLRKGPRTGGTLSVGGMATKLDAARQLAHIGIPTVIAHGKSPTILHDILRGKHVGTLIRPETSPLARRKHWIVYTLKPRGTLRVDEGARKALADNGRSLLPSGVVGVEGRFERGEAVSIVGPDGKEFARGLVGYSSHDTRILAGKQSREIEAEFGYTFGDAVIHRNDLVVLDG